MADKLSDVELVEELRRFGEEVKQPIDRKKRPILVKKLNHLKARENASNRLKKATNSRKKQNVEFSSEDESEIEDVAAPTSRLPGRKSLRQNTSAYSSITDTIEMSPNTKRTNFRSRRSITSAKDPPVVNSSQTNTPGPSGSARLYPDLSRFSDADNAKSEGRGWKYQRKTNAGEDSYDYKGDFSDSDPEESMYEVVNKSMNTTFPVAESVSRNEEEEDDDLDEDDIVNDNRDYNTRFSTRLRDRHEVSKNNSSKKTTTSQAKQSKTSNHVNSFTEEEIRQYGFKTHEDSQKMKPQVASYVSTGILIIVAVFFASLGMLYIYMRGDLLHGISSVFSSTGENGFVHLPKCKDGDDIKKNCYSDSEEDIALDLVTTLESFLKSKTGENENPSCSLKEVKEEILVKKKKELKKYDEEKVFTGVLNLILKNPNWNIRVLTQGNESASTIEDIFHLETDPDLSLVVRIYGALYKILLGVLLLLSCFLAMMIGVLVLRHRQKSKEEERKKVFEIVEKIIDMVKENYDTNEHDSRQPSYMAVQHVRDQLLPPSQRRQMVPLWEKAVKFIEANESRIRVETQNIQGEDFLVWRWLPTNSSCGKVWQGQAFGENNVSAGNTLQYSPTPCLKIRNMFDADVETADDWDVNVQDAVLEKCKGITGILHIFVDRASSQGCVYMKCNSCETAYQVYRSLHGWWFDGRLVTVKYLRLELYHDRFPNSKKNTKPLLPSNNSMASLSHPYHRSLLEMT